MAAACRPPVAPLATSTSVSGSYCEPVVSLLLGRDGVAQAVNAVEARVDVVARA